MLDDKASHDWSLNIGWKFFKDYQNPHSWSNEELPSSTLWFSISLESLFLGHHSRVYHFRIQVHRCYVAKDLLGSPVLWVFRIASVAKLLKLTPVGTLGWRDWWWVMW